MAERAARRPGLVATIAWGIVFFAVVAMAAQLVIVFADYYFDDSELGSLMIERETALLAQGISRQDGRWRFELPESDGGFGPDSPTRVARIRTADGTRIFSNCGDQCREHLLPEEIDPPDRWTRLLSQGKPIAVAGGRSVRIDGQQVIIEIAILDRNEAVMWRALGHEFADHLAIPMLLQLVLVLGGSLVSTWLALRPVKAAARQAGAIDPLDPEHKIDISQMPREVAELGAAVNRSLARIGRLMREQKLFTTAVAHEIRTPLAMLQLELGQIDSPRARRMEKDVEGLARFVGQITALGRLEAIERKGFKPIDLARLGRGVVASMGPWVYDHAHAIAFVEREAGTMMGDRGLLEDALMNLITNAVTHTPPGTEIELCAGPGSRIAVVDKAGLYHATASDEAPMAKAGDSLGMGLEIVKRIAALHDGRFAISADPAIGTMAVLTFPPLAPEPMNPVP
ncbi:HAMP domain-containing sensor histidine kinase [Kaistia defluvii]|uniref:sensor histidine kinase n=1 Tax=Kaistia defluvii TaxID=410841 RepID=UPI002253D5D3|nr:HAMP domain-containing sensor histidine kinase [Kaistia defluvii]MCX5517434.1 HAMP domain-containing sensor histidine kinase [Kaistia defluvii]